MVAVCTICTLCMHDLTRVLGVGTHGAWGAAAGSMHVLTDAGFRPEGWYVSTSGGRRLRSSVLALQQVLSVFAGVCCNPAGCAQLCWGRFAPRCAPGCALTLCVGSVPLQLRLCCWVAAALRLPCRWQGQPVAASVKVCVGLWSVTGFATLRVAASGAGRRRATRRVADELRSSDEQRSSALLFFLEQHVM